MVQMGICGILHTSGGVRGQEVCVCVCETLNACPASSSWNHSSKDLRTVKKHKETYVQIAPINISTFPPSRAPLLRHSLVQRPTENRKPGIRWQHGPPPQYLFVALDSLDRRCAGGFSTISCRMVALNC